LPAPSTRGRSILDSKPSQKQAHLVVAAVRVLEYKNGRPPSVDEVAELLGQSREIMGHQIRSLEALDILHTVKSPFDLLVELRDHLQIEELPVEESGPGFQDEVEDFHRKFEEKQKKLQNLFDSGEQEKRQKSRFADLDDELNRFRSPRRPDPFGDDS
jgi:hypothetical protein